MFYHIVENCEQNTLSQCILIKQRKILKYVLAYWWNPQTKYIIAVYIMQRKIMKYVLPHGRKPQTKIYYCDVY